MLAADDEPPPRLPRLLDPTEVRVLGALLEKQQATPEYYPLTLNALVLACNQKSNREPVTDLTETEVLAALERLREHVLVWKVGGGRTEKWEQNVDGRWELDGASKAVMTLLLLRGPQTPGELRSRSDRLHPFASLDEVETTLAKLSTGRDPLVAELSRRPGHKESRFAHLVGGVPSETSPGPSPRVGPPPRTPSTLEDALAELRREVAALRAELGELKAKLGE